MIDQELEDYIKIYLTDYSYSNEDVTKPFIWGPAKIKRGALKTLEDVFRDAVKWQHRRSIKAVDDFIAKVYPEDSK